VKIGEFDLLPLSDGTFRLDGGAMFGVIPKTLWEKRTSADERNRIPMSVRPLLVRGQGRTILIDAGIGDKMTPKDADIFAFDRTVTLDRSLAAAGLQPDDIDIVIATHLHFDHAGGFTVMAEGRAVPRFRRARHFIRRGEWDDAMHPHERNRASYLRDNYVPLLEAGLVEFIDEDGEVVPGVSVLRTGGHTMHHQIVRIDSGGRTAVFAADLLPTTAHLDEPWIMGYDLYPVDTLMYKKRFLAEAMAGEYVIFFEHDPLIAAGTIRQEGSRKLVDAMDPSVLSA
jgi:glyoxylase-like metal-dependent hydrolase (beta-lactamase superfamily II)